ncbi:unnamed protein product, partial [Mesorhabditis belari]|uniref:Uncharacterized protein n=1 Tax=Mesorhabditis belari TaxID=2138241 RepID=A0AAF3EB64_9BILA
MTDKSYGTREKDNTDRGANSNEALDGMNENQLRELLEAALDFQGEKDIKDPKVKDVYNEEKQKADKELQSARKSLQMDYPLANSPTPTPPVPKPRRKFNEPGTDELISASKDRKLEPAHKTNSTTAKPISIFTCGNQETYVKEFCDWDADDESSNSSDSKNNTKRVHIPEHPKKTDKAVPQIFSQLPQSHEEIHPRFMNETKKNKMEFDEVDDGVANMNNKLLDINNKNEEQGNLVDRKKSSKGNDPCKDDPEEFELQEINEEHRDTGLKILVLSGSDGGNDSISEGEDQNEQNGVNREKAVTTGREHNKKTNDYLPSLKSARSEMTMFQLENVKPNKENEIKMRTLTYTNRFGKMVQKEVKIKAKKNENEKADQNPENSIGQKPLDEILKYLGVDEEEKKVKNKEKKRKSKEISKDENGGGIQSREKRGSEDSRKEGENELQDEVFEETIPLDNKKNKSISTPPVSSAVKLTKEIRKEMPIESNQGNKDELFITVFKSKKATKSVDSGKKVENPKITTAKSFDQEKSPQKPVQTGGEKRNSSDSCMTSNQCSSKLPPDLDSYPALETTIPVKAKMQNKRQKTKMIVDMEQKEEMGNEEKNEENEKKDIIVNEKIRHFTVEERVVLPGSEKISETTLGISFFFDEHLVKSSEPLSRDGMREMNEIVEKEIPENPFLKDPFYRKIVDSWKSFQADSKPFIYSPSEEDSSR